MKINLFRNLSDMIRVSTLMYVVGIWGLWAGWNGNMAAQELLKRGLRVARWALNWERSEVEFGESKSRNMYCVWR